MQARAQGLPPPDVIVPDLEAMRKSWLLDRPLGAALKQLFKAATQKEGREAQAYTLTLRR